jgi:FkbM family methyltransferase
MIRSFLAKRVLDYLALFSTFKERYRIAQLASLLLDGFPIQSCYGCMLATRFFDSTFWMASRYGNDEVIDLMPDLAYEDRFIDAGTNVGLTTHLAAERCGAVLSLEPSAREFIDVQRNCSLLNHPTAHPSLILAIASDRPGFAPFRTGHISYAGGNSIGNLTETGDLLVLAQAVCPEEIPSEDQLLSWPAMLTRWQTKKLVIKIDAGGHDAQALEGMERLFIESLCRELIIEVNSSRATALGNNLDIDSFPFTRGYVPTVELIDRQHFDQCYVSCQ